MKRIALTAAAGVLGLMLLTALALPFWFGREAEKSYHAMLQQLARGGWLHFSDNNYRRGWLSSTAETVIGQAGVPVEIVARHRISHGPFPLDRILAGDWRLTPVQARITSEVYLADPGTGKPLAFPPLTAETTFQLNGDGVVHAEIPPVRKSGPQEQVFDWQGLSGDLRFDREWKNIRFDARMPSLTVTAPGPQTGLRLSMVSLHSDMQEGIAGYFFGDGALTIDRLELGGAGGRVGLQGLKISSSARPAADNVNMVLRYEIADVHTAQEHFGPGQLVIELRQLDAATLMKFKNEMDVLYHGKRPPPQAALMAAGKTLALLGALSKKAPELDITRLSFQTREGDIDGQGKFVLDGRGRDIAGNPVQLLNALSGRFEISFPEPVLKRLLTPAILRDIEALRQSGALSAGDMARLDRQTTAEIVDRAFPQYLARNEFTRLLVEDHGVYKLATSVRRGQLLINGQPWHVPARAGFAP